MLPGGANINVKMAGPTLQALCALLNQLRENAVWCPVPSVAQAATRGADNLKEGAKPSVH